MTQTRPYVAPTITRPGLIPRGSTTLWCIGDVHAGGIDQHRLDTVSHDVTLSPVLPYVSATVQLGDNVNTDPATETAIFQQFMDRFGDDWHNVMGNHDIWNDLQTRDEWAAGFGLADPNYVVDLPGLRLVMLSPSQAQATVTHIDATDLAWLDEQLASTTDPCVVFCHFPIYDTVGGDVSVDYLSTSTGFYIRTTGSNNSDDVLDVLAANSNVVAWISGHTHSRVDVPGLVIPVEAGTTRFAAINTSSIFYTGIYNEPSHDRLHTMYVTWLDDKIEVRPRNHGAGGWAAVNGQRVLTVTGL